MTGDFTNPDEYSHYSPNNWPANTGPGGRWTPYGRGYVPPPDDQRQQLEENFAHNQAYARELAGLPQFQELLIRHVDSVEGLLPEDARAKWHEVRKAIINKGDASKIRAAAEAWYAIRADGSDSGKLPDHAGSLAARATRAERQVVESAAEVRTRWNGDSAEAMSGYVEARLVPRFGALQERCRLVAGVLTVLADAIDELDSAFEGAAEKFVVSVGVATLGSLITGNMTRSTAAAAVGVVVWYLYDIISAYRNLLEVCEEKLTAGGGSAEALLLGTWPRPLTAGVVVGNDDGWSTRES